MSEFIVIFSLAVAGSLVCLLADRAVHFALARSRHETVALWPGRAGTAETAPSGDPVLVFGLILACYCAIALGLVAALPGSWALERTELAFAFLCAGGLIGEIANTGSSAPTATADRDEEAPAPSRSMSRRLSAALTLVLNVAVAMLCTGQDLVQILPPPSVQSANQPQELEPILVIAERMAEARIRGKQS